MLLLPTSDTPRLRTDAIYFSTLNTRIHKLAQEKRCHTASSMTENEEFLLNINQESARHHTLKTFTHNFEEQIADKTHKIKLFQWIFSKLFFKPDNYEHNKKQLNRSSRSQVIMFLTCSKRFLFVYL